MILNRNLSLSIATSPENSLTKIVFSIIVNYKITSRISCMNEYGFFFVAQWDAKVQIHPLDGFLIILLVCYKKETRRVLRWGLTHLSAIAVITGF